MKGASSHAFFRLFTRIILKSIREDRFLTVLSILGIALGVGLFMGVNTATSRAVASFEADIRGIDPAFNYEIVHASGIDFREEAYRDIQGLAERSMPMLSTGAWLPDWKQSVDINGIYTVHALGFLNSARNGGIDLESFITRLNGVLVTARFSREHGLKRGDTLSALVYNREYRLAIVGVLDLPSTPANAVFMDLGNYQEYFGKSGYLSRIDILAGPDQADRIARMLPGHLAIDKKEKVIRNRESLINSFRYNLRFVTFLAVLVGVFLLYNTIFISVVKRRTEIGILRGLGMDRKTVVGLFSAQGILLGFAGSILGLAFGKAAALLSTSAVARTITRFSGSASAPDSAIGASDALAILGLGLLVSFLASLMPALESANVRPVESSRAGTFERAYRERQRILSIAGLLLILLGIAVTLIEYRFVPFRFPWLSHAGILLFILGCTLNAPAYLGAALHAAAPLLRRLFPTAGRVAAGDIRGTRYRFSLALMSVAVSSALIIAIVSSIHSLKSSFIGWIDRYLSDDVYIKAASCASNFCFHPLPPELVEKVERLPEVESIGIYRALRIEFRGSRIIAGFGNSESLWKDRPGVSSGEKERLQGLASRREVHISDYLAVQYGLKPGDVIELDTPRGKVPFTVNDSSISYSTMSGFMYFDRRWLKEYWGLDDATQVSVRLKEGRDVRQFIDRLEKTLGRRYAMDITDNRELRESVLRVFDRSFAVTYAIELIAIVISLIGVVNALLILVLEKKREISVLRYLGAAWSDIRAVMVLAAGLVGTSGIVLGGAMGTVIGTVITHVINKISFGWEVAFRVPFLSVSLLMALLLLVTLLAGVAPAVLARKIDPKAYISFE